MMILYYIFLGVSGIVLFILLIAFIHGIDQMKREEQKLYYFQKPDWEPMDNKYFPKYQKLTRREFKHMQENAKKYRHRPIMF